MHTLNLAYQWEIGAWGHWAPIFVLVVLAISLAYYKRLSSEFAAIAAFSAIGFMGWIAIDTGDALEDDPVFLLEVIERYEGYTDPCKGLDAAFSDLTGIYDRWGVLPNFKVRSLDHRIATCRVEHARAVDERNARAELAERGFGGDADGHTPAGNDDVGLSAVTGSKQTHRSRRAEAAERLRSIIAQK